MENLIRYFCYKGLRNFSRFKFERKRSMIMREHFLSNKDVKNFNLYGYVQMDKYGRWKMPKYILKQFAILITNIGGTGYLLDFPRPRKILTYKEIEYHLLNPNEEIYKYLNRIQTNINKDVFKSRVIKLMIIKNKLKERNK
jgi:hypothetical protein